MTYHRILVSGLLIVTCFTVLNCSNRVNYITSDGAQLPVMKKGNKDSHNYLVVIAGGPAGDGILYHYVFPFFKQLEKDYQVVYYDQRGSGNAKGEPAVSSFNLNQHTIDLDKIILSVKNQDDQAKVFLVGYSYGGSIALKYLKKEPFKTHINGAIMISGAFDRKLQAEYQQKLTLEFLQEWVDEGYIDSYDYLTSEFTCPPTVQNCTRDSIATVKKVNKRFKKIAKASKFPINLTSVKNLLHYGLFAPGSPFRSTRNEAKNASYFQPEFDSLMLSNNLKITTPLLLIAGRLDTNVPYYDAKEVLSKIDTTQQEAKLLILENSGHLPMFTEPELMQEAIQRFVKK